MVERGDMVFVEMARVRGGIYRGGGRRRVVKRGGKALKSGSVILVGGGEISNPTR